MKMPEIYENHCSGRIDEIDCEDRISALPDDLLLTILCLVPTKDAIATMILSKRWRYVWTMLPRLEYKENDVDDSNNSVWWFLNQSMELHEAPKLEVLYIQLGRRCPTDAKIKKWITKAVDRHVVMLELKLRWSADPIRLPNSVYNSKSLVHLNLSHKILVDFPSSSCLPSLLQLELHFVMYEDEASLTRLLSSCPVLEDLSVKRNSYDNVTNFSVHVSTLQLLVYENYAPFMDDENHVVYNEMYLFIDTPTLTSFTITDYRGDSWSFQNMPCLEYGSIDVDRLYTNMDEMLRYFCSVSSLDLHLTDEMFWCCSNIKFSQLEKCTLYTYDSDWMDSLVSFLHNTPKLKSLTIDYSLTQRPPNASSLWMDLGSNPDCPICLVSSLEKFEIVDYGTMEEEKKMRMKKL